MHEPITVIPAATLVLVRHVAPGAPPELLMIERNATMAFAAGALVFPGGRVDPGDRAVALMPELLLAGATLDLDECAARVAAIRETIEEVGIAVGLHPEPAEAATAALRDALADGADFAALLASEGYRLDLDCLTLFAWWRPSHPMARNFDTRFYLAAAPADATGIADGSESVHAVWRTAADVLFEADAGRGKIIFPTRRNLERLAGFRSLEEARADATCRTVRPITPVVEDRDGSPWLCIPDDQGYPVTAEAFKTALRG